MTQDSDYLEMLDKFDKQAAKAFEPVRSEPLVCISETEYNKLAMTAATFKMALLYMRNDSRAIRLTTTEQQHAEIMDRIDAALAAIDALAR